MGAVIKIWSVHMARVCEVTGKGPMVGNNVSHANNKTKRRFLPNLQYRRFWVETENRWVRLRISTRKNQAGIHGRHRSLLHDQQKQENHAREDADQEI